MIATDHVLRHAAGHLVDFPDIAIDPRVVVAPWRWVASVWPDSLEPGGWARQVWAPGERGWQIPYTLIVGDVIEFGIAWYDQSGSEATLDRRWYGWVTHGTERALVLDGPHPDANAAFAAARPTIDEIRLAQLTGPTVEPELLAEWDRAADEA